MPGESNGRAATAAALALILTACGGAEPIDALRWERSMLGDTVLLTSAGDPPLLRVDSVRVLWRSAELERPRSMAAVGGRLAIGDRMPSYDLLRFGEDGRLWVRTVGEGLAHVHPNILRRRPELGPTHRPWDVFDAAGRLTRTVELPAAFDPRVFARDRLFGFLELPTGEITIGVAALVGGSPGARTDDG